MSDTVIRVETVGKKYIIGHQKQQRYTALRDVISDGAKYFSRQLLQPFGKKIIDPTYEEFWALKDVSFEIKQGDVVGIIGHNGAGKSTLLKILSRITEPSIGRIAIKGRVASLLEVGTGFHPELTGRENIYLNGAILGMSKIEIKKKFDEIVAFAEIEKFIDTPVKRYSSGMYVRLAFAVGAHLEPDILLVDEVLAVGDLAFQKKCLDKIALDARIRKVTSLYVSHNISTIKSICKTALFLQKGQLIGYSYAQEICQEYLKSISKDVASAISKTRLEKSEEATIYDCWLECKGIKVSQLNLPDTIEVHAVVDVNKKCFLSLEAIVKDNQKQTIGLAEHCLSKGVPIEFQPARYKLILYLPYVEFATGKYSFDICIGEPNRKYFDYIEEACELEVFGTLNLINNWSFNQATKQGSILWNSDIKIQEL